MRVLIADDDPVQQQLLEFTLRELGCEVVICSNGSDAWTRLEEADPPRLAILDWMMPGSSGPEVCRHVRERPRPAKPIYLILLTSKTEHEAVVEGLEAGADDFISKPFHPGELRARVQVGLRIIDLQEALAGRVQELEAAFSRVNQLQGLLPICSYCKKIRDDRNYWNKVESYISRHADVRFSHGICPECFERVSKELNEIT